MAPARRQAANTQDDVQAGPSDQLREQTRSPIQEQSDRELIAQLRDQVEALTAALTAPENPVTNTIERDTPVTTTTISGHSGPTKYSKKRPDPPIFTDNVDPTFES